MTAALRSTWFRALVTVGVLAWLAREISLAEAARAIASLDLGAAALVVVLLGIDRAVMIWRWLALLRATGHTLRAKSAAWIYLVSSFLGGFTPAGIGADVARAYTLGRRTSQNSDALASVAIDRLLGMIAILLVGAAAALVWGPRYGVDAQRMVGLAGLLVVAGAVALLFADVVIRAVVPSRRHGGPLARRILRVADATSQYRGHRGTLAFVLLLSVGVQLLRIAQAFVLGRGIGVDVEFSYYLFFMPISLLTLLLPISVAGFGIPQAGIVWLLARRGVPEPAGFALSTLIVLSGIAANLPGAWLYVRERSRQ